MRYPDNLCIIIDTKKFNKKEFEHLRKSFVKAGSIKIQQAEWTRCDAGIDYTVERLSCVNDSQFKLILSRLDS